MNNNDKVIDLDMERKKDLIARIKKCDSLHNNCDFLLEHSDCDDIVEYVEQLEKDKEALISWLENKMEGLRESINSFGKDLNGYVKHEHMIKMCQTQCVTLQEVLKFVNKGDKLNELEELSDKEIELYRSFNKEQLDYICNMAKTIENLDSDRENLIAFLEGKISHLESIINDSKIKPYGEELYLLENSLNRYQEILGFMKGGKDE